MTRARQVLRWIAPQLATLVDEAPTGEGWTFEIKYDGYRLEALLESGSTRLLTRRGNDWTGRFPDVARRLDRLAVKSAVLDGEVVALDASGKSTFAGLQQSLDGEGHDLVYFVFDLLHLDGEDLRSQPLSARRHALEQLLRRARATTRGAVRLGQRLEGDGAQLITAACRLGLEGIIGKRLDAPYQSRRSPAWVKVKCGHRQEFVVIGFTPPQGSRESIGSLLLGVHQDGTLRYAGRVGSGIPVDQLRELHQALTRREQTSSPLAVRPAGLPRETRWVEPSLVVEVSFTEWTEDGLLRHPVFQGVREDKPARMVHREDPVMSSVRKTSPGKAAAKAPRSANPVKVTKATKATKAAPRETTQSARRHAGNSDDNVVAGVTISHPERVVFPEAGITKLELARHFERVARVMLPHVAGRPLSLVRCPEGSGSECFFQKHWSGRKPPSIDGVPIVQGDGKPHLHVMIHDVEGLVTLVQWGVMEVHPWGSRADDPEKPDRIIFDLDPGPGVTWDEIKEATAGVRALLDGLGLQSWLKTSGGKGLHVVLPVARRGDWESVSSFARAVAMHMQNEFPDRFIAKSSKAARHGVIFVDWLRNTRGATAVAPWSTRARAAAGVSVPVDWSELPRLRSGDQFTVNTVRDHPPTVDPWADMLTARQGLTAAMLKRLRG